MRYSVVTLPAVTERELDNYIKENKLDAKVSGQLDATKEQKINRCKAQRQIIIEKYKTEKQ